MTRRALGSIPEALGVSAGCSRSRRGHLEQLTGRTDTTRTSFNLKTGSFWLVFIILLHQTESPLTNLWCAALGQKKLRG